MTATVETIVQCAQNLSVAYQEGGDMTHTAQFYSNWANDNEYDQQMLYLGPEIAASAVADLHPAGRAEVKVLDVAAGTGFVAEHLRGHGFRHCDALDPAEGMLQLARAKGGLYDNFLCCFLDDNPLPTLPDTYDVAVTSGGMGEGHIPYSALGQLCRVVRRGGHVVIAMREAYLEASQYRGLLEPHMAEMEEQGLWQCVSRTVIPNYCWDMNGLLYVYKVTCGGRERSSLDFTTNTDNADKQADDNTNNTVTLNNINEYNADSTEESNADDSAGESNGEYS